LSPTRMVRAAGCMHSSQQASIQTAAMRQQALRLLVCYASRLSRTRACSSCRGPSIAPSPRTRLIARSDGMLEGSGAAAAADACTMRSDFLPLSKPPCPAAHPQPTQHGSVAHTTRTVPLIRTFSLVIPPRVHLMITAAVDLFTPVAHSPSILHQPICKRSSREACSTSWSVGAAPARFARSH